MFFQIICWSSSVHDDCDIYYWSKIFRSSNFLFTLLLCRRVFVLVRWWIDEEWWNPLLLQFFALRRHSLDSWRCRRFISISISVFVMILLRFCFDLCRTIVMMMMMMEFTFLGKTFHHHEHFRDNDFLLLFCFRFFRIIIIIDFRRWILRRNFSFPFSMFDVREFRWWIVLNSSLCCFCFPFIVWIKEFETEISIEIHSFEVVVLGKEDEKRRW